MKNYCPLPFGHITVNTTGVFQPCCQHIVPLEKQVNIANTAHEKWFSSDYMENLRDCFSNDQQHPGCRKCWQDEKDKQNSLRLRILDEYKILGTTLVPKIVNAEIQLGNLCNLKCMMCSEEESSSVLAENQRLGIASKNQKEFTWSESAWKNLTHLLNTDIKLLSIRGGEPLYNKSLLDIVENLPEEKCRSLVLQITTNATVWNTRWQNALRKFKLVRFMFSVDATDELYDYMRYPASWTETSDNIKSIIACSNVKPLVHAVVQNLNVHALGPLIDWCQEHDLYLEFDQLLRPDHLRMTNLLPDQKSKALENLKACLDKTTQSHLIKSIKSFINKLESVDFDPAGWQSFMTQVGMRDRVRGTDFRKFLPTKDRS